MGSVWYTEPMPTRSRSFRIESTTLESLDEAARHGGVSANQFAARILEEGLRMHAFPGIAFARSQMGYRPVLAGTRLAVWEVAATLLANSGDTARTSTSLGLRPDQVGVCARYYAAYQGEVDAYTKGLEDAAARERALHDRQHAIFS